MNGFLGVTHFDYPQHLTVQQHYQDPACLAKCEPMIPLHLFSWHIFQYPQGLSTAQSLQDNIVSPAF